MKFKISQYVTILFVFLCVYSMQSQDLSKEKLKATNEASSGTYIRIEDAIEQLKKDYPDESTESNSESMTRKNVEETKVSSSKATNSQQIDKLKERIKNSKEKLEKERLGG